MARWSLRRKVPAPQVPEAAPAVVVHGFAPPPPGFVPYVRPTPAPGPTLAATAPPRPTTPWERFADALTSAAATHVGGRATVKVTYDYDVKSYEGSDYGDIENPFVETEPHPTSRLRAGALAFRIPADAPARFVAAISAELAPFGVSLSMTGCRAEVELDLEAEDDDGRHRELCGWMLGYGHCDQGTHYGTASLTVHPTVVLTRSPTSL